MAASQVRAQSTRAGTKPAPRRREITGLALGRDGTPNWCKIANRDPGKVYVLASKVDADGGVPHYESLGYEFTRWSGLDGPRLSALREGHHEGDVQEFRSHVLMELSKADHERLVAEGEDGQGGQAIADMWESMLKKSKGRPVIESPFSDPRFSQSLSRAGIHGAALDETDEARLGAADG